MSISTRYVGACLALQLVSGCLGMDKQPHDSYLMGLNKDVLTKVFKCVPPCNVTQDQAIGTWIKLQEVCRGWLRLLAYERIADYVGCILKSGEESEALESAVRNGCRGLAGIICKLCPTVCKAGALETVFSWGNETVPWLKMLLILGADPNTVATFDITNHADGISCSVMEYITLPRVTLRDQEREACVDLLVQYKVAKHAQWSLPQEVSGNIVSKLLDYGLFSDTAMSNMLRLFLGTPVMQQLLNKGAVPDIGLLRTTAGASPDLCKQLLGAFALPRTTASELLPTFIDQISFLESKGARSIYEACMKILIERFPKKVKRLRFSCKVTSKEKNIDLRGATVLHLCALKDDVSSMECIIKNNPIEVDVLDDDGNTPLYYARLHKCVEAAQYLLLQGADIGVVFHKYADFQYAGLKKIRVDNTLATIHFINYVSKYSSARLAQDEGQTCIQARFQAHVFTPEFVARMLVQFVMNADNVKKMYGWVVHELMYLNNTRLIRAVCTQLPGFVCLADTGGNSLLHHAAYLRRYNTISYLLTLPSAKPAALNNQGKTYQMILQEYEEFFQ